MTEESDAQRVHNIEFQSLLVNQLIINERQFIQYITEIISVAALVYIIIVYNIASYNSIQTLQSVLLNLPGRRQSAVHRYACNK